MAVAVTVAVAVSEGGAVSVAGLTKIFESHPKRFLNQCLGLNIQKARKIANDRNIARIAPIWTNT